MTDESTVDVYFLEQSGAALSRYAGLMSRARAERLAQATDPGVIGEGCAAELLLAYAYAIRTGRPVMPVEWATRPGGKPYIPGDEGTHFNLSHTPGRIMLAMGGIPVGADVERISPKGRSAAKLVFSPDEYREYVALTDGGRMVRFVERWTATEAYHKLSGRGFTLPATPLAEEDGRLSDGRMSARLTRIPCGEGFAAALCTYEECAVRVFRFDMAALTEALEQGDQGVGKMQ